MLIFRPRYIFFLIDNSCTFFKCQRIINSLPLSSRYLFSSQVPLLHSLNHYISLSFLSLLLFLLCFFSLLGIFLSFLCCLASLSSLWFYSFISPLLLCSFDHFLDCFLTFSLSVLFPYHSHDLIFSLILFHFFNLCPFYLLSYHNSNYDFYPFPYSCYPSALHT